MVVGRGLLAVDGHQQFLAAQPADPVEHEVGEQHTPVDARQGVLNPSLFQPHHEPAAELDLRVAGLRHRRKLRKISERFGKRTAATNKAPDKMWQRRLAMSDADQHSRPVSFYASPAEAQNAPPEEFLYLACMHGARG